LRWTTPVATHAQNGGGEMIVDTLKITVNPITTPTPVDQFNFVNQCVKGWIKGIEEKVDNLKNDECITFGLDKIERTDVSLVVEYIAIIDKKKIK